MKFGNWTATKDGINYNASGIQRFNISHDNLVETMQVEDHQGELYKWILLATEEDALTQDDLYDLNFAFVYAVAQSGATFDYTIFDETLAYQFVLLDYEENDQVSEGDLSEEAEAEQMRKEAFSERD